MTRLIYDCCPSGFRPI